MKRDLDLVRSILLRVEGADGALGLRDFSSDAYTDDVVAYHLQLMENRGLIDASFTKDWSGSVVKATIAALRGRVPTIWTRYATTGSGARRKTLWRGPGR